MRADNFVVVAVLLATLSPTSRVRADPCGMVPPIYFDSATTPIERIGLQKTYVFYKDGLETLAIRPGFTGQVDQFGMLIPFPTPPAIRKIPDEIFAHIAAAVDPPEVVIDLRWQRRAARAATFALDEGAAMADAPLQTVAKNEVRVLREEAVGMYEVVVLEAGSARALKRWMDDHRYRYPNGMDKACEDYVQAGWCFVAVRTKVGDKAKADPRPGQTGLDTKLSPETSFAGHVQAMGFRFRSDKLVVPMRLSTFNEGDLHNVVYLLTDRPSRIDHVPAKYVVRQLAGRELLKNVNGPLPLRILGGSVKDIRPPQRESLKVQRDPEPHNGFARELFASDLVCAASNSLAIDFEETEKDLLKVGELLNLRGTAVDQLHHAVLAQERAAFVNDGLAELAGMSLTVIDGDFPRHVLATDNLTFSSHRMPRRRNGPSFYDARRFGPAPEREGTVIHHSLAAGSRGAWMPAVSSAVVEAGNAVDPRRGHTGRLGWIMAAVLGAVLLVGRRYARGRQKAAAWLLTGSLVIGMQAQDGVADQQPLQVDRLLDAFQQPDTRELAVSKIRQLGPAALDALAGTAGRRTELPRRGWAIACLSQVGGKEAARRLHGLAADTTQPLLVRIWCMSALYLQATNLDQLIQAAEDPLPLSHVALQRPFRMRLAELLAEAPPREPGVLLDISSRYPFLNNGLLPAIRGCGSEAIVQEMLSSPLVHVRRQAAAVLGSIAGATTDHSQVAESVLAALRFSSAARQVPWRGGPLFLPSITWDRPQAHEAVEQLLRWWLWCERKGLPSEAAIISNNLWAFSQSTGLVHCGNAVDPWLLEWGRAVGHARLRQTLELTGVTSKQWLVDHLRNIESANESVMLRAGTGWKQVGILRRQGDRVEIVHLNSRRPLREWVAADQVVSTLPDEAALEMASVHGKYSDLLHVIKSEQDVRTYQDFRDYGFWNGRSYADQQDLQPGYWVYVFPNWYVWRTQQSSAG